MNSLTLIWALLSLLFSPAVPGGVGSVTLLEGSLRVLRSTNVFLGLEGMQLKQGDILETSDKGFAQLEFAHGAIVAVGPSTRLYIFRQSQGGTSDGEPGGAELVLLTGWLKGEVNGGGSYRYVSPMLGVTTTSGTVVLHGDETGCDVFVESGSASIGEVSSSGTTRPAVTAKAGQFLSRRGGKGVQNLSRPAPSFVESMPVPFKDTLPSRLTHVAGKAAEPKAQHQVSYAEIQAWLMIPSAWRRGFVERFEPRLQDPEFRKQLELHVDRYPEWEPVLHPEKTSQSPQARN